MPQDALLIIVLIIAALALIAVVIFSILILKRKPISGGNSVDLKEIGALSKQLEDLNKDIQKDIELALAKEMIKVSQQDLARNETQNQKLERFQENITKSLNSRFDSMNQQLETKIIELNKKVDDKMKEGFASTSETMTQVRERLQAIDDAQKNIQALSQDVVSLKTVLEGNQTRGQYGEYQLSMVLHNVFGDTKGCYEEQYTMRKVKDGDDVRADAVVFMPEPNKMICIDSKFPFADYQKMFDTDDETEKESLQKVFAAAVKKHITVIKDKYIVDGKTAPEALMFIPNDGVFAYVHHNLDDVVAYAREKRVIITSPSTLPAILVTINMVRIEAERAKNVKEISKQLQGLGKQFDMFSREWETFSRQLETATRSREKLDTRVNRITGKFDSIKSNDSVDQIELDEEPIDEEE